MREIKFRCFDTLQGGKFEYWDSENNKHDGIFWEMIKDKSFKEPNQFTGLKDKNGKDIYDGDILQLTATRYDLKGKKFNNVVQYWVGGMGCGFRIKGGRFTRMLTANMIYGCQMKVIGNKFEHPELLK